MRDVAGKIAYRKVRDASPDGLETRITAVEGINAEARIAQLEAEIATLLNHTHSYEDDDGTTATTKTTGTEQ